MASVEELQRQLREAEARAAQAEQQRQEEQRRAEQAEQQRQEEQRRAEQAEQKRQEEQRRAEQAEQRAEQAEQQRQEEQRRAEQAEGRMQLTTLHEYIAACHHSVFALLTVERDRRLTTMGSITNPRNKLCPTLLKPWPNFLNHQKAVLETLYQLVLVDARVFESQEFLMTLGRRVAGRAIADEKTLEYFMHNSVEDPVRLILEELKKLENVRRTFNLGHGIIFENHPHAISDVSEEVAARESPSTPPQAPVHRQDLQKLRPDQICIYRSDGDDTPEKRTMIYVCEYKAPHKLTAPHLRAGLRELDIYKEVVNRKTVPTSADPNGRFRYQAERLTASALTQTYHYMIEGGLEYGLMTTGEATVFLNIDWMQPGVLYYHLAEPGPEVSAHPEHMQSSTAVGQYLAFTLMALGRPGEQGVHSQDERDQARSNLNKWAEDFETTVRTIPASERTDPDSGSSWAPTTYKDFDRSPILLRKRSRRGDRAEERERKVRKRDESDPSDDESWRPGTPTPSRRREASDRRGRGDTEKARSQQTLRSRARRGGSQGASEERQWCTQACLLGLVRGDVLDPSCPNVRCHNKTGANGRAHHPISHSVWLQLLGEQLRQTLDIGVTKLWKHGARGVLFKVTLLAYGYTVACKGTVKAFISDLEHEAAVYERLARLQGVYVPVLLGAVDLRPLKRVYYYDHRVYIVHMTFMSWGGDRIDEIKLDDDRRATLKGKTLASLRAIHQEGVVHKDVRCANMLFNPETDSVMMIDFERALLLQPSRRALVQLVPNKRKRDHEGTTKGSSGKQQGTNKDAFTEDNMMARAALCELEMMPTRDRP